jgi:hypothetical protein
MIRCISGSAGWCEPVLGIVKNIIHTACQYRHSWTRRYEKGGKDKRHLLFSGGKAFELRGFKGEFYFDPQMLEENRQTGLDILQRLKGNTAAASARCWNFTITRKRNTTTFWTASI